MQAAGFVVSDAVAGLWAAVRDRHGFAGFAERAAPQLIRWGSPHGWTRRGDGRIAGRERSLAQMLAGMLQAPDHWAGFAACYAGALDAVAAGEEGGTRRRGWPTGRERQERARALADWHGMLLDRLASSEAEGLLDRIAGHPALGGPELVFVQARLADLRGDTHQTRELVHRCLEELPGHRGFHALAEGSGAPLPPRARDSLARRRP